MQHDQSETHIVGYGTYFLVWLALVMLTGLTVAISGMRLHGFSIIGALLVAAAKSSLVLAIFMHLRYERSVFRLILYAMLVTLAVILMLTFSDVWFR